MFWATRSIVAVTVVTMLREAAAAGPLLWINPTTRGGAAWVTPHHHINKILHYTSCQTVGASPHSRAHKSLTLPPVYMHMACCWKWLDAPNY